MSGVQLMLTWMHQPRTRKNEITKQFLCLSTRELVSPERKGKSWVDGCEEGGLFGQFALLEDL